MNCEESLLFKLNELLNCNEDCKNCSVCRKDDGDEESWCGANGVIRSAIYYIEYFNKKGEEK
jgi:hypothetical protein